MDPSRLDDITLRLRAAGCVFAEDEAALLAERSDDDAHLEALVARRVAGEPLEHVLGYVDFHGLRVAVDPGVFVPRQRTALLVDEAAALGRRTAGAVALHDDALDDIPDDAPGNAPDDGPEGSRVVVVDLCCGAGALGLATATDLGGLADIELHATDVDPAAVACAARNVAAVGGTAHEGDLFGPLPVALRGRVDLLLANVPYVPTGEIPFLPREARDHEAHVALDGGGDGLEVLRRVATEAPEWLAPGGHLLTESGERQSAGAVAVLERAGLVARVVRDEEIGATIVVGTLPAKT
ncbi:methyltransferase [Cellulosimicrobium protaetiae]|uniref:Methyltransferase n=1 Tax=Cellulosimicrobium protaetiae TaxID=2587808 RepID=A0A6M5UKB5_9MICO|nr:methyltransferase [Cellulosimicrobium protaetiae]QJW37773.1 methyltransferase [Cellulosimicrobium protaetiae]